MGDFNLSAAHPVFDEAHKLLFGSVMTPGTKTSLKMKKREYSKEYDQIFARAVKCKRGDVVDVYTILKQWSGKDIYEKISDHAPVHSQCEI